MLKILFSIAMALCATTYANEESPMTPEYLYKIVSPEQMTESVDFVELTADDDEFIHFSREDQLERILTKYWANTPAIVLKIDVTKLEGDLVFEANPGGTSKYYHLYDGAIPLDAIADSKEIN